MNDFYTEIGQWFCVVGGGLLALLILGLFVYFAGTVWIKASNRFRVICKAESLIFEYLKYRDKVLEWLQAKE